MHAGLRDFISALEQAGELHRVTAEVNPQLEITEIADRVSRMPARESSGAREFDPAMAAMGGRALLFERVTGSDFPLAINLWGSYRRMEHALGCAADPRGISSIGARIASLTKPVPPRTAREFLAKAREFAPLLKIGPKRVRRGPCQEVVKLTERNEVDLTRLPILKCWPLDGNPTAVGYPIDARAAGTAAGSGRYITLAGMHTVHADDRDAARPASHNIGMYRSQLLGPTSLAMHWHMHHDGASHWRSWKKLGQRMPIAICLGGESVMPYGATAPLPPGISELLMCGFLHGRGIPLVRAKTVPLWVPANSEIVIEGWVSTECGTIGWHPDSGEPLGPGAVFEGPFGDHTGFYSLPDRYPRVEVSAITHRRDAIYPTTVVGLPPQEDYYLGKTTERVFLPLLKTIVHDIDDYHLPMFGCFHNAAFVRIHKAYPLQGRRVMSSVWGAGQMAWTKMVFVFDAKAPIHDEDAAMRHFFAHCDFLRDVVSVQGPLDILDHSAPWIGAGTKLGFDCTTKITGEAWNGVPLGDPAQPTASGIASARARIEAAVHAMAPGAHIEFPSVAAGRLCTITLPAQASATPEERSAPRNQGETIAAAIARAAVDAAGPADVHAPHDGAADFIIVLDEHADAKTPDSAHAQDNAQDNAHNNALASTHTAGWRAPFFFLASNADPTRDTFRAARRIAFDATRKEPGIGRVDLPVREYPPLVSMDAATAALVDRRWREYGFEGTPVPTRGAHP